MSETESETTWVTRGSINVVSRAMCLTIDRREKKLLEVYDAPHAIETLDVGDFICHHEHKTWLGERKTVQDLAASLKDLTNKLFLNITMRSKH